MALRRGLSFSRIFKSTLWIKLYFMVVSKVNVSGFGNLRRTQLKGSFLIQFPNSIQNKLKNNRQKKGLSYIYSGISALSMDEKNLAELHFNRSKRLIKTDPLKLLLQIEREELLKQLLLEL